MLDLEASASRSASSMSRSRASSRERDGRRSRCCGRSRSTGGLSDARGPAGVDLPELEAAGEWRPEANEATEAAGVRRRPSGVEDRSDGAEDRWPGGLGVGVGALGPRAVTGAEPARDQAQSSRLWRRRPSNSSRLFGRPAARTSACQAPLPGRGVLAGELRRLRPLLAGGVRAGVKGSRRWRLSPSSRHMTPQHELFEEHM